MLRKDQQTERATPLPGGVTPRAAVWFGGVTGRGSGVSEADAALQEIIQRERASRYIIAGWADIVTAKKRLRAISITHQQNALLTAINSLDDRTRSYFDGALLEFVKLKYADDHAGLASMIENGFWMALPLRSDDELRQIALDAIHLIKKPGSILETGRHKSGEPRGKYRQGVRSRGLRGRRSASYGLFVKALAAWWQTYSKDKKITIWIWGPELGGSNFVEFCQQSFSEIGIKLSHARVKDIISKVLPKNSRRFGIPVTNTRMKKISNTRKTLST